MRFRLEQDPKEICRYSILPLKATKDVFELPVRYGSVGDLRSRTIQQLALKFTCNVDGQCLRSLIRTKLSVLRHSCVSCLLDSHLLFGTGAAPPPSYTNLITYLKKYR